MYADEGLVASINSPCVRRGRLGECTIKLGYSPWALRWMHYKVRVCGELVAPEDLTNVSTKYVYETIDLFI